MGKSSNNRERDLKDSNAKLRAEIKKLRKKISQLQKQNSKLVDFTLEEYEEDFFIDVKPKEPEKFKNKCIKCSSEVVLIEAGKYLITSCASCGWRSRKLLTSS